jgi:hypothetical protein
MSELQVVALTMARNDGNRAGFKPFQQLCISSNVCITKAHFEQIRTAELAGPADSLDARQRPASRPAIGSAKRDIRYVKHPDTKRWYPVSYIVVLLALRMWPAFGVTYRDGNTDNNHITNLIIATRADAQRHTERQQLTPEARAKGNANQDHSATMTEHWRTIRGTDEEARRHDGLNRRKAMTVEWALSFCADMEAMTVEGKRISKKAKRTWDRARIIVLAAETAPPGLSVCSL